MNMKVATLSVIIGLCVMVLPSISPAEQGIAQIRKISGTVTVFRQSTTGYATVGMALYTGDVLEAQPGATMELLLSNQQIVLLNFGDQQTKFDLTEIVPMTTPNFLTVQLNLWYGHLRLILSSFRPEAATAARTIVQAGSRLKVTGSDVEVAYTPAKDAVLAVAHSDDAQLVFTSTNKAIALPKGVLVRVQGNTLEIGDQQYVILNDAALSPPAKTTVPQRAGATTQSPELPPPPAPQSPEIPPSPTLQLSQSSQTSTPQPEQKQVTQKSPNYTRLALIGAGAAAAIGGTVALVGQSGDETVDLESKLINQQWDFQENEGSSYILEFRPDYTLSLPPGGWPAYSSWRLLDSQINFIRTCHPNDPEGTSSCGWRYTGTINSKGTSMQGTVAHIFWGSSTRTWRAQAR